MTVHEHVATARSRLRGAGILDAEARLDAELLARHALSWDPATFVVRRHDHPPATFARAYDRLVARRERREPVAFILGMREFWRLEFEVSPDTLIPRPETELIVEQVLAVFRGRRPPAVIVDAGTGTGCLAIALACEFNEARVIATDVSDAALTVARRNASRHGVTDRVSFRRTDLLAGITDRVDLVVSNPPYIRTSDASGLPPEVRDYEPSDALFAGPDGLDVIRRLVEDAGRCIRAHGVLAFELGAGQRVATARLLAGAPHLSTPTFHADLQGIPRVVLATRTSPASRSADDR